MKKNLFLLGLVMVGLTFTACSDDNNDNKKDLTEQEIIDQIDAEDNVDYTAQNATAWGNYMRAVDSLLVIDSRTLYNDWTVSYQGGAPYAEQFKNHQVANLENGLTCLEQVINGMADIANEVGTSKIAEPYALYTANWMNKENMRAGLYAVESWYSWHSRLDYSNNILSIRNAYFGVYDKSIDNMSTTPATHSMYNTVQSLNPTLNTQMVNAINGAINAIQAIPQPFRNNINTAESRAAMTACTTLNDLLTRELTSFFSSNVSNAECDSIVANIVDVVIVPTCKDLMDLVQTMHQKVIAFQQNPTTQGFADLGQAWIDARQPWESFEAFLFGPVADDGLDPNMDSWPLDREGIVNLLASQRWNQMSWTGQFNEDDDQIAAAQNLRGFHTMEFLIFKNGKTRTVPNN